MIVELPEDLAIGRRHILTLSGCDILEDLRWEDRMKMWVFRIRIICGDVPSADGLIMPVTNWYVVVSPSYPYGDLRIYPDKVEGITATFQHQRYNSDSVSLPWRTGEICVNTSLSKLWRKGFTQEPFSARERLRWHLGRAKEWISAAIRDELTASGEPFELPPMPMDAKGLLVFNEDRASLTDWQARPSAAGFFRFKQLTLTENVLAISDYKDRDGGVRYSWGTEITMEKDRTWEGIWIRLPNLPISGRWQIPETWDQLFAIGRNQGVNIQEILFSQYSRSPVSTIKFVALGFPIPTRIGEDPTKMHWLAATVGVPPKLPGFRDNGEPYLRACAKVLFATGKKIDWFETENWSSDQISTRGRATTLLQNSRIVIVGAGALGSLFSEMLLRLGCMTITVIDDQLVEIGNLARHNLTIEDIGQYKSEMLAQRLNSISPHSRVQFRAMTAEEVIEKEPSILHEAQLIIDATASDQVIMSLSGQLSGTGKVFISLSNGFKANRLFCFISTCQADKTLAEKFFETFSPWLQKERQENDQLELPWEGAGCWHPIFPARLDDIIMLLSAALKPIEEFLDRRKTFELLVIEREFEEDGSFKGIKLIRE